MKNNYRFHCHLLSTAITLFWAATSSAQISIVAEDLPQANTVYGLTTAADFEIDVNETGENYIWDFSDLLALNTQNEDFVDVSGVPFSYQFFFSNPALPDYLATHALATELELELPFVTIENPYAFYIGDEESYRIVGQGASINGFPIASQLDPIDVVYDLPMTMGNSGSSESFVSFGVPLLGLLNTEQFREYEVDGFGSITTPFNTYDCLRVKTTINATDSIYSETLQTGFNIPRPETVLYSWLAKNEGVAVLEVTTTLGVVSQIRYKDAPVSIEDLEQATNFHFSNASLLWNGNADLLTVFEVSGKRVLSQDNPQTYHRLDLPAGMYVARLEIGAQTETLKIVVP